MTGLTRAQLRAWRRRAETLHNKAEGLMSDAIDACGVNDQLTDEIDNILVATADTLSHIDLRLSLTKSEPAE